MPEKSMSRDNVYYLRQWLRDTAGATNTKIVLARFEAIKLLIALKGDLPAGFAVDESKLPIEPESADDASVDGGIAGLRMPEA